MNTTVIRRIILGLLAYAAFVVAVITYYPDKPEDMDWQDREAFNKIQITKLIPGASRDEILATMGAPDITEAKKSGQDFLQVMFYRTHRVKSDGITTQDECTPLLFRNNELVALGDNAYANFVNH